MATDFSEKSAITLFGFFGPVATDFFEKSAITLLGFFEYQPPVATDFSEKTAPKPSSPNAQLKF